MPENITLKINDTLTTLSWTQFAERIDATETAKQFYENIETAFILQCSCLVMLMQAGFLMVEAGSVSSRRLLPSVVFKNVADAILGAFFYLLLGYGLSYGSGGPFIGSSGFAVQGPPLCVAGENGESTCSSREFALLFYRLTFAISTGTILSGAIAERLKQTVYCIISTTICAWMYPIVARWAWYENGWASIYRTQDRFFDTGVLDYAGSGVVHITGSLPALILLPLLGPRKHRFRGDAKDVRLPGQNNLFTTLGTMILWMSWYGLVCGGAVTDRISTTQGHTVAKVACNTTMAAVAASLTTIALGLWYEKRLDPSNASNGILAGLVGITGACATVETEAAVFIGVCSAAVYFSFSKLLIRAKLDDVVDAVPIHFCCGVWGLIAPAIFSKRELVQVAYPHLTNNTEVPCGVLYSCDGLGTRLLAANLLYGLALIGWVGSMTLVLVLPMWYFDLLYEFIPGAADEEELTTEASDEERVGEEGDSAEEEYFNQFEIEGDDLGQFPLDRISETNEEVDGNIEIESQDGSDELIDSEVLSQIQSVYPDVDQLTVSRSSSLAGSLSVVGCAGRNSLAEHPSVTENSVAEHPSVTEKSVAEHPSVTEKSVAEHPSVTEKSVAEHPSVTEKSVAATPDLVVSPPTSTTSVSDEAQEDIV